MNVIDMSGKVSFIANLMFLKASLPDSLVFPCWRVDERFRLEGLAAQLNRLFGFEEVLVVR